MSVEPTRRRPRSRTSSPRRGRSRPTRRSRPRPTRRPTCTPRPRRTSRPSGRGSRASASTGSSRSTRPSSGTCRSRSGSSAASSTSAYNCVDRHVARRPRRQGRLPLDRRAGRHPDDHLRRPPARGQKAANALQELGVGTGDRVAIYMPMIPELPIAMLACARIGAPHTVVFGGFSRRGAVGPHQRRRGEARHHRRRRLAARQAGGAQAGRRRGARADPDDRARPRRPAARRRRSTGGTAMTGRPRRLVARHRRPPVRGLPARSRSTASTCSTCSTPRGRRPSRRASCTRPRATSSGTSYTHEMVFDIKPDDVYWCAADVGWVTGHSYIVYGPLANATTGVLYEGTPDTPGVGPLVADHRGLQGHRSCTAPRPRSGPS